MYYSSQWQVIEERVTGNATKSYVWSPVYVDAMVARDRDTDADGSLDERLYVLHDANFNVTGLVNTSGAVVERYTYDPFGTATVRDGSWTVTTTAYVWQYLHQGGRLNAESGLYSFRYREYSPTLGRWVTMDPIGYESDEVSLYLYIRNNSINYIDSYGLQKGILNTNLAAAEILAEVGACGSVWVSVGLVNSAANFVKDTLIELNKNNKYTEAQLERIANALRHAYWQGAITMAFGEKSAKRIGDAHEYGEKSIDSLIDLYNNDISRNAFKDLHDDVWDKAKKCAGCVPLGDDRNDYDHWIKKAKCCLLGVFQEEWEKHNKKIKEIVLQLYNNGKLISDWSDPRVPKLPGYSPTLPRFDGPGSGLK
jgi:RHS repeat-associated protein